MKSNTGSYTYMPHRSTFYKIGYLSLIAPVEGGHEGIVLVRVGEAEAVPELVGRRLQQVGALQH